MSEFKREERYLVFKLSKLSKDEFVRSKQLQILHGSFIEDARVDCVVVEADWPEYEPVWQSIEWRMGGIERAEAAFDALQGTPEAAPVTSQKLTEEIERLQEELKVTKGIIEGWKSVTNVFKEEVHSLNGKLAAEKDNTIQNIKNAYIYGYGDGQDNHLGFASKTGIDACVALLVDESEVSHGN